MLNQREQKNAGRALGLVLSWTVFGVVVLMLFGIIVPPPDASAGATIGIVVGIAIVVVLSQAILMGVAALLFTVALEIAVSIENRSQYAQLHGYGDMHSVQSMRRNTVGGLMGFMGLLIVIVAGCSGWLALYAAVSGAQWAFNYELFLRREWWVIITSSFWLFMQVIIPVLMWLGNVSPLFIPSPRMQKLGYE